MKNFSLVLSILLIGLFIPPPSLAAPAYGTYLPEKHHWHIGGQSHIVKRRDLEGVNGHISSTQHLLQISYGITDRLSLDLKGAAGDIHQDADFKSDISYPAYVGGGYGFRYKFYDNDKTSWVFGFQHISIHPYSQKIEGSKNKAVLDDWQLSFLGSWDQWEKLNPYGGFKWSRMDYIYWLEDDRNRIKSDLDKSIGLIAGVNYFIKDNTWLNIEGQFFDVEAFSVSINYAF